MLATKAESNTLSLPQQPTLSVTSQSQPTFTPIPTPAPLRQLLQPGLSPVFATDSPASFFRYLQCISTMSECAPPPTGVLTAGVLTLAISYQNTQSLSTTCNVLMTPSVIANISIAVPAFAKHYGFNRFQIWSDISLFQHRRMHPRFHYCTRRIVPFLSLPVLHIPASDTEKVTRPDPDFRTSLQALAANLGRGRFIATFTSKLPFNATPACSSSSSSADTTANPAVIYHYEGCDGRRDTLRTRFEALIFTAIVTRLLQRPGVCPTERHYFHIAANNVFSNIHSLPVLIPPSSRHLRNCVTWTRAAFVNPSHLLCAITHCTPSSSRTHQEGNTKICLRDVICAWSPPNTSEAAARQIQIARKDGQVFDWIFVCADNRAPSLAVVMELVKDITSAQTTPNVSADSECAFHSQSKFRIDNTSNLHQNFQHRNDFYDIARSCLCVIDEPEEFLDLTCDIAQTLASENEPFRLAVEDILIEYGVLEQGDHVLDANLLHVSELDDLTCSTVTSPCSNTLFF